MKGTIATLVAILVVGTALTLPAVSFAQAPGELQQQRAEHFPVMHQAVQQLEQTKQLLVNDAAKDFHGHKQNAVNHIDAAIAELRAGIREDRKH